MKLLMFLKMDGFIGKMEANANLFGMSLMARSCLCRKFSGPSCSYMKNLASNRWHNRVSWEIRSQQVACEWDGRFV